MVFLSTELYTGKTENSPPLTSSIIPENSIESKNLIREAWQYCFSENGINPLLKFLIEEVSKKANFPIDDLLTQKCIVLFGLKYKELILWPKEFEFFTPCKNQNVIYLGSYVDKERNEVNVDSIDHIGEKPLVYFAIGTVLDHHFLVEFVKRLIKSFLELPEFEFVISSARLFDDFKILLLPENVQIYRCLPQLQILRKCDLMITMGGANSIKECIEFEVPMLCYPFHNDQFGNSARVEFHKLGMRGDVIHDRPEDIAWKVRSIINDIEFKNNVQRFRERAKSKLSAAELKELIASLTHTQL